jgi:Brp/Blh family beta-carotene 15,15'-monooxygenase
MIIVLWFLFPTFLLIIFLVIACYHFGKEDTNFLINYDLKFHFVLYFLKGSLIVFAPLVFHFEETINLFKILLIENENFYSSIGYLEEKRIFYLLTFISVIVSFFYALNKFKIVNTLIFFDILSVIILNYLLTPLLAFTIYFCFLHSLRHSISLSLELDAENLNNGFKIFIKKAIPLTLMTVIIYVFGIYLLSTYYTFDESIIKAIFIGLASLTFPHILLEYLIEKNEQ